MPGASRVEEARASDYSILRPRRIGPRGLIPWLPTHQPINIGQPIEERLGTNLLELVGLEDRTVRVTLKDGEEVRYEIEAEPWSDLPCSIDGYLTPRAPLLECRRYLLTLSDGTTGQTLNLVGDLRRNLPIRTGV